MNDDIDQAAIVRVMVNELRAIREAKLTELRREHAELERAAIRAGVPLP